MTPDPPQAVTARQQWPAMPYKGLTYYTAVDAPLFAGRGDDIYRCAELLAEWKTRLLLLHGPTACGKSSFLRAGLIPHLESVGAGIVFARTEAADQAPVLFVRSTADPLASLADSVYRFADREIPRSTPGGSSMLRLRNALPEKECTAAQFRQLCGTSPDVLLAVLEKLSRIIPETLVLIIDQGEEVLTVDQSAEGGRYRNSFFEFLSGFTRASFDLKLLIALRTEYFGRFISGARRRFRGPGIAEYYLDILTDDQVKEAILRPTSTEAIDSLGAPQDEYQFTFEEEVISRILADLGGAGGKLPAIQIVCTTLYETAKGRPKPWRISHTDFDREGGVEGSIERFIDRKIVSRCTEAGLSPGVADQEVVLWKDVMYGLTRAQPDGSVTTDLKKESDLRKDLISSRLDFTEAAKVFAHDDVRLLRRVDVIDSHTGALIPCFGLGHDTLGLVLRSWKLRTDGHAPMSTDEEPIDEPESVPDGIALCLSGGGYRAMLFHLGALWRLNELAYLPRLERISAVSAGAIVAGQLGARWSELSFNNGIAQNFLRAVVEPIRELASSTIDVSGVIAGVFLPAIHGGAEGLGTQFKRHLYGGKTLRDLPDRPQFVINATNLQCGSLFRFTKNYLADYRLGRVKDPSILLATAVAASAAMPPVLSPLILHFKPGDWEMGPSNVDEQLRTEVHLTDGSVYDHFGLESAWKRYRTLLVSDGSYRWRDEPRPGGNWLVQSGRVTDLSSHLVRSLRRRQLIESFHKLQRLGAYWSIGSAESDTASSRLSVDPGRAEELSTIPTRYKQLPDDIQERLINFGYAICDAAMRTHMLETTAAIAFPYSRGV